MSYPNSLQGLRSDRTSASSTTMDDLHASNAWISDCSLTISSPECWKLVVELPGTSLFCWVSIGDVSSDEVRPGYGYWSKFELNPSFI